MTARHGNHGHDGDGRLTFRFSFRIMVDFSNKIVDTTLAYAVSFQ
jgi:hypothetical protein